MRCIIRLSVLCVAVGVVSACAPEQVVETDEIPTAGVRFINAVPDTGAMDFRFVDIPENSAHWSISFRNSPVTSACITASTQVQYKPTMAGQRQFRIFTSGTTAAVASTVVKDTVVNLEAGKNYTALLWGNARGGATPMRLTFFEESPPDPGAQVALRAINASGSAIDVSYYPATGAAPGTAIASNLAPLSISSYVTAAPAEIRYHVQPAGGGVVLAEGLALTGAAANPNAPGPFDASPGTTVAGSAVTAIIFPTAVAGSQAPSFSLTTGNTAALSANDSGYARQAGSFVGDCFFIGQQVTASGFTSPANNGTSIVRGIRESSTTGSTSLSATATGYARSAGSFVTNGFVVGQTITASGFTNAANNGRSLVTAVTATSLTVSKPGGTVAEGAASGRTIVADGILTVTKTGGTVLEAGTTGATSLAATATGYSRTVGDFVAEGFTVGMTIAASGFTNPQNNGNSTITAVTPTDLTVTKTGGTVVEAAGTNRLIANARARSVAGVGGRLWSFIWDRRPPRPGGV